MHDLGVPLTLALIALQLIVMLDPSGPPATAPMAVAPTLMSIVALTIMLKVPVPVSRTIALAGWAVAISASVVALRSIGRTLARWSTVHVFPDTSRADYPSPAEGMDHDQR